MWTDADPMYEMRAAARAGLPADAALKRDRGNALLITGTPIDCLPGFTLSRRGGMTLIYPDGTWLLRFEERFPEPPNAFCGSLIRFKNRPPDDEALLLFIRGAKLTEASSDAEKRRYDIAVRQYAAKVLRRGDGGGGLYALALLDSFLNP